MDWELDFEDGMEAPAKREFVSVDPIKVSNESFR